MSSSSPLSSPRILDDFTLDQSHEADLVSEFDSEGSWPENVVEELALDDIAFNAWNDHRKQRNFDEIKSSGMVFPVNVEYNESTNKYQLIDGNHRCWSCKELGYTLIPAQIRKPNSSQPFPDNIMDKWRFYNYICKKMGTLFCEHGGTLKEIDSSHALVTLCLSMQKTVLSVTKGTDSAITVAIDTAETQSTEEEQRIALELCTAAFR
jgi:hypothetical protein